MPAQIPPRALTAVTAGLVLAALVAGTLPATADQTRRTKADVASREVGRHLTSQVVPDRWLVQVSGAPSLRGGSRAAASTRQARVQEAARDAGADLSVLHTYTRVWNGFSAQATKGAADKLRTLPGVAAVYPVLTVALSDQKGTPELLSSLPMIGADVAQFQGLKGDGIKVGVIDSGIDYNHRDLSGSGVPGNNADFGPNAPRVKYGYDFVGDDYRPGKPGGEPVPDAFPDDCNGHGTHVAGIIGGDGDPAKGHVRGVAPHVTFGSYRVFGCDNTADTEVILAAMDRAAADHMDVVNLSFGDAFETWPDYPDAVAADALTDAGTLVVTSAGNNAASGLFSSGAPAVARKAISVASVENARVSLPSFDVAPVPPGSDGSVGYEVAHLSDAPPESGTAGVAIASAGNREGCSDLSGVTGKVVLLQVGTCSLNAMAFNAMVAGAVGVVVYSDAPGLAHPTVAGPHTIFIPVVAISESDGEAIAAQVAAGRATTLTWRSGVEPAPNPVAGLVSDFSAFGMAADLTLTPDVAAPGGNIWSIYPIEEDSYANLSGTSMAAPHVTGAVALMLQAGRRLHVNLQNDVGRLRAALQNTARPVASLHAFGGRVVPGVYEPTIRQGGGLVQVDKAVAAALTATTVTPGKISLGENRDTYRRTTLTLTNRGSASETYALSVQHAASVGPRPTTTWYDYVNKVVPATFSAGTVTVQPGRTATVTVSLKQPPLTTGWMYGGWVKLTRTDNRSTLVVPFAGMFGDYQSVKVLQDVWGPDNAGTGLQVVIDLPALSTSGGTGGIVSASGPRPVFTMADADSQPHLLFHLDYPVSKAFFNVYKATADGRKGGEVFAGRRTFLERGESGRDDYFVDQPFDGKIPFDNTSRAGLTVPNGDYVLELRVLRALGNPVSPHHWETYVSPAFTIQRAP